MHHATVFNYFESGAQASDTCHNSTNVYQKNCSTENPRKNCSLPRFRWTKYAMSLHETCQI